MTVDAEPASDPRMEIPVRPPSSKGFVRICKKSAKRDYSRFTESLTRSRSTVSSPTLNFSTRQPRIATFRTASAPIAKAPIAKSAHRSSANSQTCGGDSGGHCDRPGQLVLYIHGNLQAVESGEVMSPNILHPAPDHFLMCLA